MKRVNTIPFSRLELYFRIVKVFKEKNGNYSIQVLIKRTENMRTRMVSSSYDYFSLDKDGFIVSSPRGHAKDYNGSQVSGIEEGVKNWISLS